LIDEKHNFKVINWDKLYSYMEKELKLLLAEEIELPVSESIESKSYIRE